MATLVTSYINYPGTSNNLRAELTYVYEQDLKGNITNIRLSALGRFQTTGNWYRSGCRLKIECNGTTITSASKSIGIGKYADYGTTIPLSPNAIAVKHNDDGTKSVTLKITFTVGDQSATASVNLDLPKIPRGHMFALDREMITTGDSAKITITKQVSSYTSSIIWDNGITQGTLLSKSTANDATVDYDTLAAGIPTGTNKTITFTCRTYDGDTLVGTTTLNLLLNSGFIDLSFYNDGNGNLGARFGRRALTPEWLFPLQHSIKVKTVDATLTSSGAASGFDVPFTADNNYKAIAVVGYNFNNGSGTGWSSVKPFGVYLKNDSTVTVKYTNGGSSTGIFTAYVLEIFVGD